MYKGIFIKRKSPKDTPHPATHTKPDLASSRTSGWGVLGGYKVTS